MALAKVLADSAHPWLPRSQALSAPPGAKLWRGRFVQGCYSHLQLLAGLAHDASGTEVLNITPQQWRKVGGTAGRLQQGILAACLLVHVFTLAGADFSNPPHTETAIQLGQVGPARNVGWLLLVIGSSLRCVILHC